MSTSARPCGRCCRPMVHARAEVAPPEVVRHDGRGLCTSCHRYLARRDELADYERTTRSLDDTLTDYQALCGRGLDHNQIATRLGMKPASLQRQLERARARDRTTCRHANRAQAREDDLVL